MSTVEWVPTDDDIDACGFRMFTLPEIAATMAFRVDHRVLGNKREQMAQYGGAVTPPVSRLLNGRLAEVLGGGFTFKDLFCGAGGTTDGARDSGAVPILGLNHWTRACETYAENFPEADVDCANISNLTTTQIKRYPDSDVLLASPECTNHSIAKGGNRRKPQAASLWEDGPAGDDEQDRSRATMWDVVRFADLKLQKGKPYRALIVENVVDAYKWGPNDNGAMFDAWLTSMHALGYEHEIVWLNSMFAPPTPQSRDRMYVVFWQKGVKRPNLRVEPTSWCPSCERVVNGRQAFKRPDRPWGRYGAQYVYTCPDCHKTAIPFAFPAISALDMSIPCPRIGDRAKPLAKNTRERIRRGLPKLREPFVLRLLHDGRPRPLTLPIVSLTRRHDLAITIPCAGNTFERTPGNRTRFPDTQPSDTVHTTYAQALVMANTENGVPRPADKLAAQTLRTEGGLAAVVPNRAGGRLRDAEFDAAATVLTGGTLGVVRMRNHGEVTDADLDPSGAVTAGGFHHGLVMRNNRGGAEMSTPFHEPARALTTRCHQSLVIPYGSAAFDPERESAPTLLTHDRLALLVPPMGDTDPRVADLEPGPTQTTTTRASIVVPEGD